MPKYRQPTDPTKMNFKDPARDDLERKAKTLLSGQDLNYYSDTYKDNNKGHYAYNRNTMSYLQEAVGIVTEYDADLKKNKVTRAPSVTCRVIDGDGNLIDPEKKAPTLGKGGSVVEAFENMLKIGNFVNNESRNPLYIMYDDGGKVAKFSNKGGKPFEKFMTQKEFAQEMLEKKEGVEKPEHPGFFAALRHGLKKLFTLGRSGDAEYEKYQLDVREYDAKCANFLREEYKLEHVDSDLPLADEAQEILQEAEQARQEAERKAQQKAAEEVKEETKEEVKTEIKAEIKETEEEVKKVGEQKESSIEKAKQIHALVNQKEKDKIMQKINADPENKEIEKMVDNIVNKKPNLGNVPNNNKQPEQQKKENVVPGLSNNVPEIKVPLNHN